MKQKMRELILQVGVLACWQEVTALLNHTAPEQLRLFTSLGPEGASLLFYCCFHWNFLHQRSTEVYWYKWTEGMKRFERFTIKVLGVR